MLLDSDFDTQVSVKQTHKKIMFRAEVPGEVDRSAGDTALEVPCAVTVEGGLFIFSTTAHLLNGDGTENKLHCRRAHWGGELLALKSSEKVGHDSGL